MDAEVVAVGSELVSGQKLDTNSQWLSRRLGELGVSVRFHTAVGDDLAANVDVLRVATERVDLVVVSGGLGPTQDDLTREAIAALAEVPLEEHAESLRALEAFFARRNRSMPLRNRVQALLPAGAEPLANRTGTAPGVLVDVGNALVACLPGVPSEQRIMFDEELVPKMRATGRLRPGVIVHRVVNLFGKGESEVEALAMDLTARARRPEVGITASDATISLRVSCEAATEAEAIEAIEPTMALIRERFAPWIVGEGGVDVTESAVAALERAGATVSVAESCTGGLIASRLTSVPGVSAFFPGGVVSYSNEIKRDLLGVPESLLATHGAVSAEVAEAMAEGVRRRFGTTFGVSVTGVAGPDGGSAEKPVGLVYLGLAGPGGVSHRRLDLGSEQPRDIIRSRSAKHALNWLRLAAGEIAG